MLMDDPISALDANVKKKIFEEVFQGLLRNKTRILVTHAVDFLHLADRIVIMQGGRIQAQGTLDELQSNAHMKQIIETHHKNTSRTEQAQSTNPPVSINRDSLTFSKPE